MFDVKFKITKDDKYRVYTGTILWMQRSLSCYAVTWMTNMRTDDFLKDIGWRWHAYKRGSKQTNCRNNKWLVQCQLIARQAGAAGFPFPRLLFTKRRVVCRHTLHTGGLLTRDLVLPVMALGLDRDLSRTPPSPQSPPSFPDSDQRLACDAKRGALCSEHNTSGPRQGSHPPATMNSNPSYYFNFLVSASAWSARCNF